MKRIELNATSAINLGVLEKLARTLAVPAGYLIVDVPEAERSAKRKQA